MDGLLQSMLTTVLLCSLFHGAYASNILLMPFNHGAHINFFCVTGESLLRAGHDVYVIVPKKHNKLVRSYEITPLNPDIKSIDGPVGNFILRGEANPYVLLSTAYEFGLNQTKEILDDKNFIKILHKMNFDLVIIDGMDFARSNYIIPYKLSVPFITMTPRPDPWTFRVPSLPSTEGVTPFTIISEESNIIDRIFNCLLHFITSMLVPPYPLAFLNDNVISELVPEKENIGFAKLFHNSEMVIVNMDIICLDFQRISSPYYQFVGGIGAQQPKPLSKEFNEIMTKSTKGVIVVTFGSAVKSIPYDMLMKMLNSFKDLKENVIMRHESTYKEQYSVPDNVFMTSWLPQNDLLGHPNTKLFITHVGNNGQLEAVYHGVPMLMMPMFGDQFYNTWRAEQRGYGKMVDPRSFTTKEMKETILELINNKTYHNNIKKCSKILQSLPAPQEKILFWVNHILEFGGSHLKPFYLEMPLWKYFMLDVLLVLIILICMSIFICRFLCVKCLCRRNGNHQKLD